MAISKLVAYETDLFQFAALLNRLYDIVVGENSWTHFQPPKQKDSEKLLNEWKKSNNLFLFPDDQFLISGQDDFENFLTKDMIKYDKHKKVELKPETNKEVIAPTFFWKSSSKSRQKQMKGKDLW